MPFEKIKDSDSGALSKWPQILRLAIPSILCSFITKFQDTINIAFIGRNGDAKMLAGVGLANMTQAFLGYMFIIGLNSSIETFVSQAAGANNMKLCGIYLNRGRFIMTCAFIPISILLLQVENVLIGLGQNVMVAGYA